MKILGVESSATSASASVVCDGKVVSLQYTNTGLTHSQTLMPMIDAALKNAGITVSDVDYLSVSNGPGSFTGIRIGVAAVKGLAFSESKKCVPVSTLEVIAKPLEAAECYAVSVMDARCMQFYTATFDCSNGKMKRMCEDRAISADELKSDLLKLDGKKIILIGDGADVAFEALKNDVPDILVASHGIRYQSASSVALCAYEKLLSDENSAIPAESVLPVYLRLSQAERELKLKKEK